MDHEAVVLSLVASRIEGIPGDHSLSMYAVELEALAERLTELPAVDEALAERLTKIPAVDVARVIDLLASLVAFLAEGTAARIAEEFPDQPNSSATELVAALIAKLTS